MVLGRTPVHTCIHTTLRIRYYNKRAYDGLCTETFRSRDRENTEEHVCLRLVLGLGLLCMYFGLWRIRLRRLFIVYTWSTSSSERYLVGLGWMGLGSTSV